MTLQVIDEHRALTCGCQESCAAKIDWGELHKKSFKIYFCYSKFSTDRFRRFFEKQLAEYDPSPRSTMATAIYT